MSSDDVSGVTDENLGENDSLNDGLPKTQEELSKLIGREKLLERDKIKREMEAKQRADRAELEALKAAKQQESVASNGGASGNVDPNIDEIVNSKIQETLSKRQQELDKAAKETEMQRVADTYFSKLGAHAEKDGDFQEMVEDFDHMQFPQLIHAVHGFDNMGEMMGELLNNPTKLEKINAWLRTMPDRALKELRKLSDSIRETSAAFDEYQPTEEPLSETRPSNVGAASGLSKLEQAKQKYRF